MNNITNSQKETMVNFLNENIKAVDMLLNPTNNEKVMGFPSAVLLLSIIDAIGTVKKGEKNSFEVLKDGIFGNQKVNTKDLHDSYRNLFLHNNLLLPGRILSKGDNDNPFLEQNGKVIEINLLALYKICKVAVDLFTKDTTKEEVAQHPYLREKIKYLSIKPNNPTTTGSILAQANDSSDNPQITGNVTPLY